MTLLLSGCGARQEAPPTPSPTTQVAPAPQVGKRVDPETAGSIVGKIMLLGEVPAPEKLPIQGNPECSTFHQEPLLSEAVLVSNGALQNVFVYIKEGLEGYAFEAPQTPAKLDQVKCMFIPHVVGVQTNQPLEILNSDPTLHNVHALAKVSPGWNIGLPAPGMRRIKTFPKPEVMVPVKCDVHPWMLAYIGVVPHPYFAVTGPEGTFTLQGVPPGRYVIEAWHERFGTKTQELELAAGESRQLELTFP